MSWLMVGIARYLAPFSGFAPRDIQVTQARTHINPNRTGRRPFARQMGLRPFAANPFAQNQIAPSASRGGRALGFAEDHDAATAVLHPIDLTLRSQRQRLSFFRRGAEPWSDVPNSAKKASTFSSLFGDPAGRSDWRSSPPAEKCAVCIGANAQVKPIWAPKCDGASISASQAGAAQAGSIVRFARCDQLTRGLSPPSRCPCRAHRKKGPPWGGPLISSVPAKLLRRRQRCGLGGAFGLDRRLLLALSENERIALDRDFADLVHHGAGAGRDQPADNDVFLEPVERIGLAIDCSFGEHARRLLERGRGDERAGLQRGLGDAEQYRMGGRRLLALRHHTRIDLVELDLVDLLALDQIGLAGVVDLDLLQHLADDHFDVLVIDRDALQPIDILDLVDEIAGKLLDPFDRQDVVRRRIAFDNEVALLDHVAVLQVDVLALGDEVLPWLLILIGRLDGDAPLVLVVAAEANRAGDFRDDRGFLRPACLEQLGDTRQTAGNVARLRALRRDTRDDIGRLHVGARIDRNDGVDRQHIAGFAAAAQLEDVAILVLDHDGRTQILLAAGGARAPIDHHAFGDAGRFVKRLRHRLPFDEILEADRAFDLGEDRPSIGIPLSDALAALNVIAVVHLQPRAILNTVHGTLGAVRIDDRDHEIAAHHD